MLKYFLHRHNLVRGWRKRSPQLTKYFSDVTFIDSIWNQTSYRERLWELTPKSERPKGMLPLWKRNFLCVVR